MKEALFQELIASVREGGAILRSERKPSRRFKVDAKGVRSIRESTQLSQAEFARLIGVSVRTLQNWEQERRKPTGPAAALLRVIQREPEAALRAIHGL
jgi:putative transcriptional regulator